MTIEEHSCLTAPNAPPPISSPADAVVREERQTALPASVVSNGRKWADRTGVLTFGTCVLAGIAAGAVLSWMAISYEVQQIKDGNFEPPNGYDPSLCADLQNCMDTDPARYPACHDSWAAHNCYWEPPSISVRTCVGWSLEALAITMGTTLTGTLCGIVCSIIACKAVRTITQRCCG